MDDESYIGYLKNAILALIGLAVLIWFLYKVIIVGWAYMDVRNCRTSVDLADATHLRGVEVLDAIDCPMLRKETNKGEVKEIEKFIANEMAECWYKFGEGQRDLFKYTREVETFCAICSRLDFKGDAKEKKLEDFPTYLTKYKVPKKYDPSERTYWEFLTPVMATDDAIKQVSSKLSNNPQAGIDTSVPYITVYVHSKNNYIGKLEGAGIGASAGTVVGTGGAIVAALWLIPEPTITKVLAVGGLIILGAGGAGAGIGAAAGASETADWYATTMLIPYTPENVEKMLQCDYLPVKQQSYLKQGEWELG